MDKKQPIKAGAELEAQVALAAIGGRLTVQQIMKKYGVSKTGVYTWKRESEEKASALFGSTAAPSAPDDARTQKRTDNLHRKIGELEKGRTK